MKKFPFLLLDAGPIIKLVELDIWDEFIKACDISILDIVANQAERKIEELLGVCVDIQSYDKRDLVKIVDLEFAVAKTFYDKFDPQYKAIIHPGEKETLAFLCNSSESWLVCSADGAVFKVLGLLGKGDQGISLQEILNEIGLSQSNLEWRYTKKFRENYTRLGRIDFIQDKGLL